MNFDKKNYFDKEVTFTYDGIDYLWIGDYSVESYGEDESEYAPAYGDSEVEVEYTSSLASCDDGQEIAPTTSMIEAVEQEIKNNL